MKKPIALTVMASMLAALAAYADELVVSQVDPVVRTADQTWVGESELLRSSNRIQVVARTTDLDPGSVVTGWWRIYNRPGKCAVPFACEASDLANPDVVGSQLHATGFVVENADGDALIVASLYRTAAKAQGGNSLEQTLDEPFLNGRGLRRPLHAEVELLLASHGRVADPSYVGSDAALAQLLSPTGTQLECADPAAVSASRTFRCGVLQKVNHPAIN